MMIAVNQLGVEWVIVVVVTFGLVLLFRPPYSDHVETQANSLKDAQLSREAAKPTGTTYRAPSLRIVLAWRDPSTHGDGQRSDPILELFQLVIKKKAESSTVLTFHDGEEAWGDLSRTDPDLLVVRCGNQYLGDLLRRLGEKKVKYPILLLKSAWPSEHVEETRRYAGPSLNLTMLELREDMIEDFLKVLEAVKKTKKSSPANGSPWWWVVSFLIVLIVLWIAAVALHRE